MSRAVQGEGTQEVELLQGMSATVASAVLRGLKTFGPQKDSCGKPTLVAPLERQRASGKL